LLSTKSEWRMFFSAFILKDTVHLKYF